MKQVLQVVGGLLLAGVLSAGLAAQTASASRNDAVIQSKVAQQFTGKKEFQRVSATVEDGIVTLTGGVDLYQQKLDAAKKVRKIANVQGVRNLIVVNGNRVPDAELAARLDRKLYYDRLGEDNLFNFVTASVENGVATLSGETRDQFDRDSALALANTMPGVSDVIDNIKVAPASNFDDQIRIRTMRAIYRDPVLSRYAIDPARPIRIVVDHGQLSLYGTVGSLADKQIAGIRAGGASGAFSVQNNLQVAKKS